jgi:hypothetical protein
MVYDFDSAHSRLHRHIFMNPFGAGGQHAGSTVPMVLLAALVIFLLTLPTLIARKSCRQIFGRMALGKQLL